MSCGIAFCCFVLCCSLREEGAMQEGEEMIKRLTEQNGIENRIKGNRGSDDNKIRYMKGCNTPCV